MSLPGEWFRRILYLVNRQRRDRALAEEMAAHREMMGAPARFGQTLRLREEASDVWGWRWLDDSTRDVRFAVRSLRAGSAYTLTCVASLTLGFAAVAVVTAAVNAYLIRPLPFPGADRLYRVVYAAPGQPQPREIRLDWSTLRDIVEKPLPASIDVFYVTDGQYTSQVGGALIAPDALDAIGARVTRGRLFVPSDVGQRVALITDAFWRTRFGADPGVIGRSFRAYTANGAAQTESIQVIGVLAPDVWMMREGTEIVVPLTPRARAYQVRLREDVPAAVAERRMTAAIRESSPGLPLDWSGVRLERLHDSYVATVRPVLNAMAVIVALALAMVCINVAVLTVLRVIRRARELAVRVALGAGQLHVLRTLGTEAIVLCVLSGIGGTTVAGYALPRIAPSLQQHLGVAVPGGISALTIDLRVVVVVTALTLTAALLLALLPLAVLRWRELQVIGRAAAMVSGASRWSHLRTSLVALEIAGALALLVGAGLMSRTVFNLVSTGLGFTVDGIVRAHAALPAQRYRDAAALARFSDELVRELRTSTPRVAVSNFVAFYEPQRHPVHVDGQDVALVNAGAIAVSEQYFDVLGIGVAAGRSFASGDKLGSEPVAIVSESLAKRLWPDAHPLGQRIRTAEALAVGSPLGAWRTVVGVVRDVKQTYTDADPLDVYLPFSQVPSRFPSIFIATSAGASQWLDTLRQIVRRIDPEVTVDTSRALSVEAADRIAMQRFLLALLASLSVVTMSLAVIGVYGVTAYALEQRRREVAIRLAVGATPRAVRRMFLKQGSRVVVAGAVLGVVAAFMLGQLLRTQLYGVDRIDWPTLVASGLLVAAVTCLTAALPVRRVMRTSPALVLKSE